MKWLVATQEAVRGREAVRHLLPLEEEMEEVTNVKMNASQGTCLGSLHTKRLL